MDTQINRALKLMIISTNFLETVLHYIKQARQGEALVTISEECEIKLKCCHK